MLVLVHVKICVEWLSHFLVHDKKHSWVSNTSAFQICHLSLGWHFLIFWKRSSYSIIFQSRTLCNISFKLEDYILQKGSNVRFHVPMTFSCFDNCFLVIPMFSSSFDVIPIVISWHITIIHQGCQPNGIGLLLPIKLGMLAKGSLPSINGQPHTPFHAFHGTSFLSFKLLAKVEYILLFELEPALVAQEWGAGIMYLHDSLVFHLIATLDPKP